MTAAAKSKEEVRVLALHLASDFVSDWDRVYSIIGMMEDVVNNEVQEAGVGQMETWAPEVFAANTYWLRALLEDKALGLRKALGEAGFGTGPRV